VLMSGVDLTGRARIGNVQSSAAPRNGGVDREDPLSEHGQHLRLKPTAQDRTLRRIAPLGQQNPISSS
jgi:hypothetical protein